MSFVISTCPSCGTTYHWGCIGSTFFGGHVCPNGNLPPIKWTAAKRADLQRQHDALNRRSQ